MNQINRDLIISQSCQYGWASPTIERAQEISSMLNELIGTLEKSNSVSIKTGWQPHHYIEKNKKNDIIAICPLYIKNHSFGEYIFDHAWADAYHRNGLNYYPKLQSAIPFTPVTGNRLLISNKIKDWLSKNNNL